METVDLYRHGQMTGPLGDPGPGEYRVQYRNIQIGRSKMRLIASIVIAAINVTIELVFIYWLLFTYSHYPQFLANNWSKIAGSTVIVDISIMEVLRLGNVISLSHASVVACDPVPVTPQDGLNVAFCTTFVPGKEPIEMLRRTLEAARRVEYPGGNIDVWLLDEGDNDEAHDLCVELGVHYYTRAVKAKERNAVSRLSLVHSNSFLNQPTGRFKAKTKHGNYNAAIAQELSARGYDILLGVDTDHVPLPWYAERMLGYFRDPRVAFVVAPQFYGNTGRLLTRGAESQQYPFHSIIQRAGNRYHGAMLVGTNLAIRLAALDSVGGFSDSVTEDMATGLNLHATRIQDSKRHWQSVYTPDTVAIGEGPANWSEYFGQQLRWSRGTFQLLAGGFWRLAPRLSVGKLMHYLLIMSFYPSMAVGWILGAVNSVLVLGFSASGLALPINLWMALYGVATFFQLTLYILNRDHNVSPFEDPESPGLIGMMMSVLVSPIYANSMISTVFRREPKFVTTAKGQAPGTDRLFAFWRHIVWALIIGGALVAGRVHGTQPLAAYVWPIFQLGICLIPIIWWLGGRLVTTRTNKILARPAQPVSRDSISETESA